MSDEEVVREKWPGKWLQRVPKDRLEAIAADDFCDFDDCKTHDPKIGVCAACDAIYAARECLRLREKILQSAPREDKWVDVRQELRPFDELYERSKDDRAFIAGSEVREVIGRYRVLLAGTREERLTAQQWRDNAFETSADIAERYGVPYASADIRALKSPVPLPPNTAPPVPKEPVGEEGLAKRDRDSFDAGFDAAKDAAIDALKSAEKSLTHGVPEDCWATGPLTGDAITDLVVCPGCSALSRIELAYIKLGIVKSKQEDGGRS